MAKKYWTSGTEPQTTPVFPRPTTAQAIRQVGIIALIGLIWGGIFAGYLSATTQQSPPLSTAIAAETAQPANTATRIATESPTPQPTATPLPTEVESTAAAVIEEQPAADTPTPQPTPTTTDTPVPTDTPSPEPIVSVSFAADVLPVLERRCLQCHGGDRVEDGFVVSTYQDVMAGSWNGLMVTPGNAADSYLIDLVESGDMPKRGPRLLPSEIDALTAWIEAGAPDN